MRLTRLLEPLLDLEVIPVSSLHGDLLYLDVRGHVRPRLGELPERGEARDQRTAYELARRVRGDLARRAEQAVTAVEANGFRHERHPVIETGGRIRHASGSEQGPDLLIPMVTVRLSLVPPQAE